MDNWRNEYLNIYDKHNAKYLFELSTQISTYKHIYIRHLLRSRRQWFEAPSRSLSRQCNVWLMTVYTVNVYFVKRKTRNLFHWHDLTHWDGVKMAAISRHFQMHFLDRKGINFYQDFTEICSQGSNWYCSSTGSDNGSAPDRRQATGHYVKQLCSSLLTHKCVTWPPWVNWDRTWINNGIRCIVRDMIIHPCPYFNG